MFVSRKHFGLTLWMLLSTSLLVYACGGGGGSSSGGGGTTTISNASQGSQAASSGTQAAQAGTGLSDLATSLGQVASGGLGITKPVNPLTLKNAKYAKMIAMNNKVARSKAMQKVSAKMKASKSKITFAPEPFGPEVTPCDNFDENTDSGSITLSGTIDSETGAIDLDVVFDSCREDFSETDGTVSLSATATNDTTLDMDMVLDAFTITDYDPADTTPFTTVLGVMTATVTIEEQITMSSATAMSFDLEMDGSMSFVDQSGTTDETTTIAFNNFANAGSITGIDTSTTTFTNELDGGITQSTTEQDGTHSVAITFTNFDSTVVAIDDQNSSTTDLTFSGTVATDFTPNEDCGIEGTFSFVTETAIRYTEGESCPVQGRIVINGNTGVDFNDDSSVDITVGSETQSFASCDELFSGCEVEDDFVDL
ncbi:MAG: hypothetical protein MPW14_17070 [Candidatus Manganitrophus sp.]|nr:hypothetical protein [Candidatus Manganitrophus sp.]MDC4224924.1 hypothetical protein [Candidatus Manganitrophus sp.]WDT69528.1 MAG: hypothetical protein MPW17_12120 [Candidatus Manganitrophus sp.]WDT78874.1 MAG: hypothetical protein MPW14_17070 [Candidatus Manganitrophus sp.]